MGEEALAVARDIDDLFDIIRFANAELEAAGDGFRFVEVLNSGKKLIAWFERPRRLERVSHLFVE